MVSLLFSDACWIITCLDQLKGIDVALCRISSIPSSFDLEVELLDYKEVPVTSSLRSRILGLVRPGAATTLEDVCDLNFALGEEFASAVHRAGIDLSSVDLIASHGQTLWHTPVGERISTLQMAEPAVISKSTKKYDLFSYKQGIKILKYWC